MCPLPRPLLLVQVTSEERKGVTRSAMLFAQVHSRPVQIDQPLLLPWLPTGTSPWLERPQS